MPSITRMPRAASSPLTRALIATSSAPEPAPTSSSRPNSAQRDVASGGKTPATAKKTNVIHTRCSLARFASLPVRTMAGSAASATATSAIPSSAFDAPTERRIAGSDAAQAPHHSPNTANAAPTGLTPWGLTPAFRFSELEIPVDEVVLLQAAEPLADLARADGADTGDRLEISLRRADDRLEVAEAGDDLLDQVPRQPGDVGQDPVAARRDRVVEWIDVARVAHQLGEPLRFEQLAVGQCVQPFERELGARAAAVGVVVVYDGGPFRGDLADELVQLHADEPRFGSQLDAVALDLRRHARRHLRPLQHHEHVVEHDGVLELERRQPRQHLVEPLPVRLQRRERLIRLREHLGNRVELVARLGDVDRDRRALLRDGDDERTRLLRDTLGRAMPRAGLVRRDRRVRHQLHVRVRDLRQRRRDDDRAVHLGQLVEELRRERLVETHAAGEQERELVRIAEDDQRSLAGANDVVDRLAQLRPGSDALEGVEQLRIAARIVLRRGSCEPEGGLWLLYREQFVAANRPAPAPRPGS